MPETNLGLDKLRKSRKLNLPENDIWTFEKSALLKGFSYASRFNNIIYRFLQKKGLEPTATEDLTKLSIRKQLGILAFGGAQRRKELLETMIAAPKAMERLLSHYESTHGAKPFCLDLLSYGAALRSANLPGISVALKDIRTEIERDLDNKNGRIVIEGDILKRSTWNAIQAAMEERNPTGFNIIMERGIGPVLLGKEKFDSTLESVAAGGTVPRLPITPVVYGSLLQRMYGLLEKSDGMILAQTSSDPVTSNMTSQFINYASDTPGLYIDADQSKVSSAFLLHRTSEAPATLTFPDAISVPNSTPVPLAA